MLANFGFFDCLETRLVVNLDQILGNKFVRVPSLDILIVCFRDRSLIFNLQPNGYEVIHFTVKNRNLAAKQSIALCHIQGRIGMIQFETRLFVFFVESKQYLRKKLIDCFLRALDAIENRENV